TTTQSSRSRRSRGSLPTRSSKVRSGPTPSSRGKTATVARWHKAFLNDFPKGYQRTVSAVITSELVKELRDKTGAGMMDCKQALAATGGDMEKAIDHLRKKGAATAEKRADRITNQGVVEAYIHAGGRIGAMVEVNCETDFVAKTDDFRTLARDLAM